MVKMIWFCFCIFILAGCHDKSLTRARLKAVQHTMDSINQIGYNESNMSQQRFDSLGIRYDHLYHLRDSLLKELDSVVGLKHED